jgi:erythromycin esterase-like protein
MDSVVAYVRRVAPVLAPAEEDDYSCLSPYRNDQGGVFDHDYSKATTLWPFCTPRVADAYNALVANRTTLEAGSSPAQFARALQLARVVVQWESVERGAMARDAAMAENATWILQHANGGAQSKVFLWAHNAHVGRVASTTYTSMGAYLSTLLLTNYLPIGFAFGSGSFNAQGIDGAGNITPTVRVMTTSAPRTGSFEEVLQSSRNSAFYFDMRPDTPDDVTSWLVGPEWLRVVGTAYDPTAPDSFFEPANLAGLVDVMVFVRKVTPTKLVGQ